MSKIVNEIKDCIQNEKEAIEILPKKGVKKLRDLHIKLEELIEDYSNINNLMKKEIESRYSKITEIQENPEIEKIKEEINKLDNISITNEGKTSFEKMHLDKIVYDMNGYYKKDLNTINKSIYECIQEFKKVGIELTEEDFSISEFSKTYIQALLEEAKNGNINSKKMQQTFEESYWKCSEIIYHILVNIRCIYDREEEKIDKYFDLKAEGLSKDINSENFENKKEKLIKKYDEIISKDEKTILDNFVNKTWSVSDYKEENYQNIYSKLIKNNANVQENLEEEITNLNQNLQEYKTYLEYKFISDEILKIRNEENSKHEKDTENKKQKGKKQKTQYEISKEQIENLTKEIFKLNAEIERSEKKTMFSIKNSELKLKNKILQRDNDIIKLKKEYDKLDEINLKQGIASNIKDISTLLDVLKYASYDYGFLAKTLIKNNPEITDKEIASKIKQFRHFVRMYYFTVINNVNINEKKDIAVIIKDKYNLIGFNLSKEDFSENALDDFIRQTEIVKNYLNIQKSNITVEDMQFVLNAKEILNK